MTPRRAVLVSILVATSVTAAIMWAFGNPAWPYALTPLTAALAVNLWYVLRWLDNERDQLDGLMALINKAAVRGVRCAGCHMAAVLATVPVGQLVAEAPATDHLPPGWAMIHDRPYCGDCIAKGV